MKLSSYCKLAETVTRNAPRYRTKTACSLALRRVRVAHYKSGSYGFVAHLADTAVRACQDRWMKLDELEWNARIEREAALCGPEFSFLLGR